MITDLRSFFSSGSPSLSSSIEHTDSEKNSPSRSTQSGWIIAPLKFFGKLFSICIDKKNSHRTSTVSSSSLTDSEKLSTNSLNSNRFPSSCCSFDDSVRVDNISSGPIDHIPSITALVHRKRRPGLLPIEVLTEKIHSCSLPANTLSEAKKAVNSYSELLYDLEQVRDRNPELWRALKGEKESRWRELEKNALQGSEKANEVLTHYLVEERNNQDYKALEEEAKLLFNPEDTNSLLFGGLGNLQSANKARETYKKFIAFIEKAENASPKIPAYPWENRKKEALERLELIEENTEKLKEALKKYDSSSTAADRERKNSHNTSPITVSSIIGETEGKIIPEKGPIFDEEYHQAFVNFKHTNTTVEKAKRVATNIRKNFPSFPRSNTPSTSSDEDQKIQ